MNSLWRHNRISMETTQLNKLFFLIVLLSISSTIWGQSATWKKYPSPVNSVLDHVILTSDESGFASGTQLLVLKSGEWARIKKPSSSFVSSLSILNSGDLCVGFPNKFQETDLYFYFNKSWEKIKHPFVSPISSTYFSDRSNGVIVGLGEICLLKNNIWTFLPPPVFRNIKGVLINNSDEIFALSNDQEIHKFKHQWIKLNSYARSRMMKPFEEHIYVLTDNSIGIISGNKIELVTKNILLKDAVAFDVYDKNSFVAIGINGLILNYSNGVWKDMSINPSIDLKAVDMIDSTSGWCVGQNGDIFHFTKEDQFFKQGKSWNGFEEVMLKGFSKMIDDEYGVVVADFNDDGKADIFTCGLFEAEHLYINIGDFFFKDDAKSWGLVNDQEAGILFNLGACANDLDNDGFIDLYVTCLNGKNIIYKNLYGKRFIDISSKSGGLGKDNDRTNSCIMGDVDNDGDIDLFLVNEYSSNRLYLNNGAGVFYEHTDESGLFTTGGGMGATFGDIDNDGDLDLYVCNWSNYNFLYKNRWSEKGQVYFEEVSEKSGTKGQIHTKSNSALFNDLDKDGDLDLFVGNRKSSNLIYINDGSGNFIESTEKLIGFDSFKTNGVIIEDFDGDGYKDIYLTNVGENTFYKGAKDGCFYDQTEYYNLGLGGYSTGAALGDFDNDNDFDIYVASFIDKSSLLLRNKTIQENFIKINLKGYKNNNSGIGSKIYTYENKHMGDPIRLIDFREMSSGQGYASMNEQVAIIAISDQQKVDIRVVFPDGNTVDQLNIESGQNLTITDVKGWEINKYKFLKKVTLILKNQIERNKVIKWVIFLLLLAITLVIGKKRFSWKSQFRITLAFALLIVYFLQSHYFEFENFPFAGLLPLTTIIIFLLLLILVYERKWVKNIAIEQQKEIKEKISRDLHDDLAATISTTNIYLELIKHSLNKNDDVALANLFDKTQSLLLNAGNSVSDLIWSIKAKPESLEQFSSRIQKYHGDVFFEKGIQFNLNLDKKIENRIMPPNIIQNTYLIIKEALNNMAKYAEADIVEISIQELNQKIKIEINDNGVGFDMTTVKGSGHGISNMQKRAKEIGADFNLKSEIGRGSSCVLYLPVKV